MSTWKLLGYAGLTPFIGCLVLSVYIDNLGVDSRQIFIAYSAVILSFIAGSLWRISDNKYKNSQLISNIFSLIAFTALCIDDLEGLIILATSYPLILFYEVKLRFNSPRERIYLVLRCTLTLLVFVFHIIGIYMWYIP